MASIFTGFCRNDERLSSALGQIQLRNNNLSVPFQMSQYAPAVLQTITNPDGTVSLIQVDPNNPIITLPDGTTAQVTFDVRLTCSYSDERYFICV